jgi:hypothetical protein
MSYIAAGNTTTTSLTLNADTTGNLIFTTSGANTTALTLTNTQIAIIAGTLQFSDGSTQTTAAAVSGGLNVTLQQGYGGF